MRVGSVFCAASFRRSVFSRLLWLYQMGILLFWVYDRSPHQQRTQVLFNKTLSLMLLALKLAEVPLLKPLYRPAGELLKTIYGEAA